MSDTAFHGVSFVIFKYAERKPFGSLPNRWLFAPEAEVATVSAVVSRII
jgi:hypothetical protein